jgi:hypothetical protein
VVNSQVGSVLHVHSTHRLAGIKAQAEKYVAQGASIEREDRIPHAVSE